MEGRRMPARYRMDEAGQMRRTWNGKLPEEFNERDMLLFAADTDLALYGRVSDETLNAARKAGYSYENGALMPLQEMEHQKEDAMEKKNFTVARIVTHTRSEIGKCERHNERKNESYGNMNVDLGRTPMNIHFRDCGGDTYRVKAFLDNILEPLHKKEEK